MRNALFAIILLICPFVQAKDKEVASVKIEKSNDKVLALMEFVEEAFSWRQELIVHTTKMKKFMDENEKKIRANHYIKFQVLAHTYVQNIRKPLEEVVTGSENFLLFRDYFDIQTKKKTSVSKDYRNEPLKNRLHSRRSGRRGIRFKTIRVKRYSVNPNDEKGQLLLRSFKMQLAAKLTLIDNYTLGLSAIMDDTYLRRTLLWDLEATRVKTKNAMFSIWRSHYKNYQNPRDIYRAHDVITQANKVMAKVSNFPGNDKYNTALDKVIENSLAWKIAAEKKESINIFEETVARVKLMNARQFDGVASAAESTMYHGSKWFGNFAGSFYLGKGKLYNSTDKEVKAFETQARALDVVFEKTGFRLTDSFIPGHFTHAAVWSGTEQELKDLDVWDELPRLYELVKKNHGYKGPDFQSAVRSGHRILEALRPGVQFNTMRHFMDIDDLVFLRPKTCADDKRRDDEKGNPKCLTNKMKKTYLIESFKQVGKEYDFNFDVNTRDRIVCSELVYRTFIDTDFVTTKTAGRHTIVTDQIVPHADDAEDLMYPTVVIINGVDVGGSLEHKQEMIRLLSKEDYPAFEKATGISTKY